MTSNSTHPRFRLADVERQTEELIRTAASKEGMPVGSWIAARMKEAAERALSRSPSLPSPSEGEITQADRDAAAKALGYRDWDDATDYRLTGAQDRQRDAMVEAFARHRRSHIDRLEARAAELERLRLDMIAAWEALPGGQRYTPAIIQEWLSGTMKPAFDRARESQ